MARPAPASTRAAHIISFLTAHPSRGFTISELVTHLDMNIASAHATLAVLCDCGFLVRDPVHRTYILGPALAVTGFAATQQHPSIVAAIEQADALAAELDMEVGVSAVAGTDVILLARRGPEPPHPTIGYPGDRAPLMAPLGAIFVAWAEDKEVDAWLERGAATDQLAHFYREMLAQMRGSGFSVPMEPIAAASVVAAFTRLRNTPTDEDAEHGLADALQRTSEILISISDLPPAEEISFRTVAAPIFDPIGRVLLAMSISGPDHPVRVDRVRELGRRLTQATAIATHRTHGRPPARLGH
ncbi:IclR family transcriptional regulator [Nocardia sp. BMG111209]|uniref:IclR family transcriptional regulator n=1 Tax=Nocardia sp. BMG111209 TaxID=1160137 RepID=UPI00036EF31A|nr:helix-turn-helix domain-containing protein [Nocardia sp. BMG111209]